MVRWLVGAIGLSIVATHALAAGPVEIGIGYLAHAGIKSKLSLVEQPAENDGIAGARLAIEDNNTTGRFLNQHFTLEELRLKESDDVAQAAVALASRNGFIVADLPADAPESDDRSAVDQRVDGAFGVRRAGHVAHAPAGQSFPDAGQLHAGPQYGR